MLLCFVIVGFFNFLFILKLFLDKFLLWMLDRMLLIFGGLNLVKLRLKLDFCKFKSKLVRSWLFY